jgi:hypothetical protein
MGNLNRRIAESDNIILVSIYKKKWIPPEGESRYGSMTYYARVVNSFKGDLITGRIIEFSYSFEDSPRWLGGFESLVEGDMKYLFLKDQFVKKEETQYTVEDVSFSFNLNDPVFFDLFRKKLTPPSKIIDPRPTNFD